MDLGWVGVMTAVNLITWLTQLVNRLCHCLIIGAVTFIIVHAPLERPSLRKLWGISGDGVWGDGPRGQASAELMIRELV